jgi:hypothetical protein
LNIASAHGRALWGIIKKHIEINFNRLGCFNVAGQTWFQNISPSVIFVPWNYHLLPINISVRLAWELANTPIKNWLNVTRHRKCL